MLDSHGKIVILTGAGISAESGIPTFRGPGGLWENHRAENLTTPGAFAADPELVHRFYNMRRRKLLDGIEPNAAHRALSRLQQDFPGEIVVVTQNVDHLHEAAGFRGAIHMHGEILKARCTGCRSEHEWMNDLLSTTPCPACGATGHMRPAIVWFGEIPLHMNTIEDHLSTCSIFVAIGTSGHVYPAAGFVQVASAAGARTIEINVEPGAISSQFQETRWSSATEEVPRLVDELLAR
jgi:NAD-dependent deacetylase